MEQHSYIVFVLNVEFLLVKIYCTGTLPESTVFHMSEAGLQISLDKSFRISKPQLLITTDMENHSCMCRLLPVIFQL